MNTPENDGPEPSVADWIAATEAAMQNIEAMISESEAVMHSLDAVPEGIDPKSPRRYVLQLGFEKLLDLRNSLPFQIRTIKDKPSEDELIHVAFGNTASVKDTEIKRAMEAGISFVVRTHMIDFLRAQDPTAIRNRIKSCVPDRDVDVLVLNPQDAEKLQPFLDGVRAGEFLLEPKLCKQRNSIENAERTLSERDAAHKEQLAASAKLLEREMILTRRQLIMLMLTAGIGLGLGIDKWRSASQTDSQKKGRVEAKEIAHAKTPFEILLEKSLLFFVDRTRTKRDNILDQYAVSKYFLGGKFLYRGDGEGEYKGAKQRMQRFTLIGKKSGYSGKKGEGIDKYQNTKLADAINYLLDLENLTRTETIDWIVWMYAVSFGIRLESKRIKLKFGEDGKITNVAYSPPEKFDLEAPIEVAKVMKEEAPEQPGGNMSKEIEFQKVLDSQNRLLLPSGISPTHDVIVPASIIKKDPSFVLSLNGYGIWELEASVLSGRITSFENRLKNAAETRMRHASIPGRTFDYESIAPVVERNDQIIKELVKFLLKDIDANDHSKRIEALLGFVQSLPYKSEYDTNVDRPGFLTIFNGGGDCNNLTVLFVQMMLAAGYDASIIFSWDKNRGYDTHALAGVPKEFFPAKESWSYPDQENWVAAELTSKVPIGERRFPPSEKIFSIEELSE